MEANTSRKFMPPLLLIGLITLLTTGTALITNIYNAFWANKSIWWTPASMKLSVEETTNDFKLFIGGKILQKHLAEKTLFAVDKQGKRYPIVSQDVQVRINNWNKVKSSILTKAVYNGLVFGAGMTLFSVGLFQTFTRKGKSR